MSLIQNLLSAIGLKEPTIKNPIKVQQKNQVKTVQELQKLLEKENGEVNLLNSPELARRLPMHSPASVKKFLEANAELVHDALLSQLTIAVKENLSEIILFRLGESELLLKLEYSQYETILNKIIEFYIKIEAYEKVIRCKQLLDKHFINAVIKESKK